MGDSDDEYDRRKGRDKFRRERNDYERNDRRDDRRNRETWDDRRGSGGRSREAWSSRSNRDNRRDPYGRDYDSRRRERFSPNRHDISPPHNKRMRRDWDGGGYGSHYDVPYSGPLHSGGGGNHPHHDAGWGPGPEMGNMGPPQQQGGFGQGPNQNRMELDYPTQPSMMTFKQFLAQQDDNINDQDAIKKYNDYKQEFKKIQINEFFLQHKEEEWSWVAMVINALTNHWPALNEITNRKTLSRLEHGFSLGYCAQCSN